MPGVNEMCVATATPTADAVIFGYQVPTGLALHITGVDAVCYNFGAATATTIHP
jgi:hypothetical protein